MTTANRLRILIYTMAIIIAGIASAIFTLTANAQTVQRAVLPEYRLAFNYIDEYVITHHPTGDGIVARLREQNLGNATAFMSIRVLEGDYSVQTIDTYLQEIGGTQTGQADGMIAGVPARWLTVEVNGRPRHVAFVPYNGVTYVFERNPASPLPEVQAMWDTIIGSLEFDPTITTESACTNDSAFVADVTIPDGTIVPIGVSDEKSWRVLNDGTCTWDGSYRLQLLTHTTPWGAGTFTNAVIPYTPPGEEAIITVSFIIPSDYNYTGPTRLFAQFQLSDGRDELFGTRPFIEVNVNPNIIDPNGALGWTPPAPPPNLPPTQPPPLDPPPMQGPSPTSTFMPPNPFPAAPTVPPPSSTVAINRFSIEAFGNQQIRLSYDVRSQSPLTSLELLYGTAAAELRTYTLDATVPANDVVLSLNDLPDYLPWTSFGLRAANTDGNRDEASTNPVVTGASDVDPVKFNDVTASRNADGTINLIWDVDTNRFISDVGVRWLLAGRSLEAYDLPNVANGSATLPAGVGAESGRFTFFVTDADSATYTREVTIR